VRVWRLNIKPDASEGVDPRLFCITNNILGVGWAVECDEPVDWDKYYALAEDVYYNKGDRGWWPAVNALKNRMNINDLCWTRDWSGVYYLGQILSDWIYRGDHDYREADVVNIRQCDWKPVGEVDSVPGKVVNSFIPRRTVQAVDDDSVRLYSQFLFNSLSGRVEYSLPTVPADLYALISSEDCEDLVGLFLQEKGYRIIPSTCRADTAAYEFVLKHTVTGTSAVAQVKQGNVTLNFDDYYSSLPREVYLFTLQGEYTGTRTSNVNCIDPDELKAFAFSRQDIMPDRVKTWIAIIEQIGRDSA
jgi:hypothetical protein